MVGLAGRRAALLLLGPLLLFLWPLMLPTEGSLSSRRPRGLLQLAGAIQCTTGRTPFAYLRYGCFCGLGGTGWPSDEADWCCFKHDCCYGQAENAGCAPKMESYLWECENNAAKCEDIEDKCQKMACKCDREAAKCLAKAPYNATYILWPVGRCGTTTPPCEKDD